jgi:hypothetical protein
MHALDVHSMHSLDRESADAFCWLDLHSMHFLDLELRPTRFAGVVGLQNDEERDCQPRRR